MVCNGITFIEWKRTFRRTMGQLAISVKNVNECEKEKDSC